MKINKNGFTLVELLIVIALIAILSVAVLATINPIEQSNKARDAKFKNDAAEVLSAYERYYTSQASYPWMDVSDTDDYDSIDNTVVASSDTALFGVINGTVGQAGGLITNSELKSSFMGKESYVALGTALREEDRMYAYHNGTTNDNYVCFHPKAAANRTVTGSNIQLKCLSGVGLDATLTNYGGTCVIPTGGWDASGVSATNANLLCVPEGAIQ